MLPFILDLCLAVLDHDLHNLCIFSTVSLAPIVGNCDHFFQLFSASSQFFTCTFAYAFLPPALIQPLLGEHALLGASRDSPIPNLLLAGEPY